MSGHSVSHKGPGAIGEMYDTEKCGSLLSVISKYPFTSIKWIYERLFKMYSTEMEIK